MAFGNKNIENTRVGRLLIIKSIYSKDKKSQLVCKCDCGVVKVIRRNNVIGKGSKTKSCGCLAKELFLTIRKDGESTHKMARKRPYRIWTGIKQRCGDLKNKNYGGRGITYAKKWETFEGFWEDMKEGYRHDVSIDRTDNNGNYCKENCRWANKSIQNRNTRVAQIFGGVNAIDASLRLGGNKGLVSTRMSRGWTKENAFKIPAYAK